MIALADGKDRFDRLCDAALAGSATAVRTLLDMLNGRRLDVRDAACCVLADLLRAGALDEEQVHFIEGATAGWDARKQWATSVETQYLHRQLTAALAAEEDVP